MATDNDFLLEDDDDEKTIEFIKNYLPQELKEKFTDDDLYYMTLSRMKKDISISTRMRSLII